MNASVVEPEPSPSTGPTSVVTGTSDSLAPEARESTTSGATSNPNTRYSSVTQTDHDMVEEHNVIVTTNPSRSGLDRDTSRPRVSSPTAMEIDSARDLEIMEISSPHSPSGSCIPASYRNLPATHYFIAPPVALPYPRSPVRHFPEGHPLHTQPSIFGYLPRAPPRSPRLDPLEILELESARERNEWEQVCKDLGRPKFEPSSTVTTLLQPHSITPSIPQTQTQVDRNDNKISSQAPPSDDDYDSDSSDVELRIYNADPIDEIQTPSQPDSVSTTLPRTPLGARPAVAQLLAKPNGFAAHRSILERLSQGPSTPRASVAAPETTGDRLDNPPKSHTTTPAKRKIDDVEQVASEPNAKRKSPAAQQRPADVNERNGVPPLLRAEVGPTPKSSMFQAPTSNKAAIVSQTATPQPTPAPGASTTALPVVKSGMICRFHNRPPGRVCVRKDQCPDLHIGELQRLTPGTSFTSVSATDPSSLGSVPPTSAAPSITATPITAPPLSRAPSLADAPLLGTDPSPPPRPTRPPCRYFLTPGGCTRPNCLYPHILKEQTSRPPSRQLAPSPIPIVQASTTTPVPIPVHIGPKVLLPTASLVTSSTAAKPTAPPLAPAVISPSVPTTAPAIHSVPTHAPVPTPTLVSQPAGTIRTAQPAPTHPLPAKPTPTPAPQQPGTSQAKGKGKGKGKAAQAVQDTSAPPANANKPGGSKANQANVKVKTEPETSAPNTKAAKRKGSGSQPKPQPARVNTGSREIKQEEITLYDLAGDSPQEPTGSFVLPPELTGSQPGAELPLIARRLPPYRPPQPLNPNSSASSQAPLSPTNAPTAPVTTVIPPTPVRPVPEQSAMQAPVASTVNSLAASVVKAPATNTPKTTVTNAPNTATTNALNPPTPAPTTATEKPSLPVPPRSNPSPTPPRPNSSPESSAQIQSRPRSRETSREPARPDSRGLVESTFKPGRQFVPPSFPIKIPTPEALLSASTEKAFPATTKGSISFARAVSGSAIQVPISRSATSASRSRSFSPSRSRSPPHRQRYEPRPISPADGYTKGSAYFPRENNIPRAWEAEAGGDRPVQNEGCDSGPGDTMAIVDGPIQDSTPAPPRNAMTVLNHYDSFNQMRTMDISPMSSPARGYTGVGLGNRISDYPPVATNDYSPPVVNNYPEQRENLLTRMTVEPDLANRLAPTSNRGQAPNRAPPVGKPTTKNARIQAHQPPLADRIVNVSSQNIL
ncbi:hypothetical protein OPQ81_008530 [Rhizoctonia solani]|nr:hypothetical protein OPQ81_008530 [Rhizoctonia solani]